MYSITRKGLVYFIDHNSEARVYLCGARITYRTPLNPEIPNIIVTDAPEGPRITAYYSHDEALAMTIWDWYTALCELVPTKGYSLSVPFIITMGSVAYEWQAPYNLSIEGKSIRVYNPLKSNKQGIYWQDAEGYTKEAVTLKSLTPQPVLKEMTLPEWAFKLGTNSSPDADAHEANKVCKWPEYLSKACARGYDYKTWIYYYRLGQAVQNRMTLAEAKKISELHKAAEDVALKSLHVSEYLPDHVKAVTPVQSQCRALARSMTSDDL